jgi:hypothetical protein
MTVRQLKGRLAQARDEDFVLVNDEPLADVEYVCLDAEEERWAVVLWDAAHCHDEPTEE